MLRAACSLVFVCSFAACDAASTLRGGPWTIASWTYAVETNNAGTVSTDEDSADDCGTLEFTEDDGGFDTFVLKRNFEKSPQRGTTDASFVDGPGERDVTWTPGGADSEADQVTIFDGSDTLWNGAWVLSGNTLSRSFGTDFGGQQSIIETSTLTLTR